MKQPLVSVIIPIYHVEDFLDRCVESVCKQTYKNLEIILVDDGSDDNCPKMCDDWLLKDNRIKVIHKKNGGLSDARNAGLKKATGELVYFLDSDDYIVEHAILHMTESMINNNADAVAFGYTKIDEAGKELSVSNFREKTYSFATEKEKMSFIYKELLQYKLGWEAWNRLYRMDIIRDNNLWFEPNKEIFAEDRCFNLYYTLCSKNIICLSEKLHFYLIRSTSIMGSQREWKVNEALNLSKKVYEKAQKQGLTYITKHFEYIPICLITLLLTMMKQEEFEYYAKKIQDKEYLKKCYKGIYSYIMFRQIWGNKGGMRRLDLFKNFIKLM